MENKRRVGEGTSRRGEREREREGRMEASRVMGRVKGQPEGGRALRGERGRARGFERVKRERKHERFILHQGQASSSKVIWIFIRRGDLRRSRRINSFQQPHVLHLQKIKCYFSKLLCQ